MEVTNDDVTPPSSCLPLRVGAEDNSLCAALCPREHNGRERNDVDCYKARTAARYQSIKERGTGECEEALIPTCLLRFYTFVTSLRRKFGITRLHNAEKQGYVAVRSIVPVCIVFLGVLQNSAES